MVASNWIRLAALCVLVLLGVDPLSAVASDVLPPINDRIADAFTVTGDTFEMGTDLGAAGKEGQELIGLGNLGRTAWWEWTAEADGIIEWNGAASSNLVAVAIFETDTFGQMLRIAATYRRAVGQDHAWSVEPDEGGSFQARAGRTYVIQLDLAISAPSGLIMPPIPPGSPPDSPESQPVGISFQRLPQVGPANDSFPDRIALSSLPAEFDADLLAATAEPGEPRISTNTLGRTLWWMWTAPGYGSATIESQGTNAAPVVGVFKRGTAQSLDLIASSATQFGNECFSYESARKSASWDVVAGEVYELQVDRYPEFLATTPARLQLTFSPAPANDVPDGAIELTGNDLSTNASVVAATRRNSEPVISTQSGANSVWYRWQAPGVGILQVTRFEPIRHDEPSFETSPGGGVIREIIRGSCGSVPVELSPVVPFVPVFGLFYSFQSNGAEPLNWIQETMGTNGFMANIIAGGEYHVAIDGADGSSPETPLNLLFTPPPANDDFTNRVVLPTAALQVTGRTFAATREPGDPAYYKNGARLNRSVWWEWSAPTTGRWMLFIDHGGYFENKFVVYRGSSANGSTEVGGSEHEPIVFECGDGEVFQIGVFAEIAFGRSVRFTLLPVVPPSPARSLLQLNSFSLWMPKNSGLPYVVERSEDLYQWSPASTNASPWAHWVTFPFSGSLPAEFFRTRFHDGPMP